MAFFCCPQFGFSYGNNKSPQLTSQVCPFCRSHLHGWGGLFSSLRIHFWKQLVVKLLCSSDRVRVSLTLFDFLTLVLLQSHASPILHQQCHIRVTFQARPFEYLTEIPAVREDNRPIHDLVSHHQSEKVHLLYLQPDKE